MNEMLPIYEIQEEPEDNEAELNTNRQMMGVERMITEYDEEFDYELISIEISKYLEYALTYLVSLILLQLQFLLGFETIICLIPILITEVRSVFLHYFQLRQAIISQDSDYDRISETKSIINSISNIFFCIFLSLYTFIPSFYFILSSIPLIAAFTADLAIKKRVSNQCQLFTSICETISKLFKILTITSISIKVDNFAHISWISALWPLWVILACFTVSAIGSFLLMAVTVISYYYADQSRTEVYSSVWLFYTTAAASVALLLFGLDLAEGKTNYYVLYGIAYLTIFLFITYVLRFHLQSWWKSFFIEDAQISIPSLSNSGPLPLPPSQARHMKLSTKIIRAIKLPPRALIRLSSTYFQPASLREGPKVIRTMSHDVKEFTKENAHFRSLSAAPREPCLSHKNSSDHSFIDKKCGICVSGECDSVFLECGHGGICHNCATYLMKEKRQCHMCRSTISQVVKIKVEAGKVLNVIGTNAN